MPRFIGALLLLATVLLAVPMLLARNSGDGGRADAPSAGGYLDLPVRVYFAAAREVVEMPLEQYVMSVVAAEVPASFATEALKAQAVVARTYAVRRLRAFGGQGCSLHPAADVCAGPEHGQDFVTREQLRRRIGPVTANQFWNRIGEAALATRGLIITYQGAPIDAVYHSTSVGSTEAAADVWGRPVPYLQARPDRYGSLSPRYYEVITMPIAEFTRRLNLPESAWPAGGAGVPLAVTERTAGGRAATVRVGDAEIAGPVFRSRLGLRSTQINLQLQGDQVVIDTYGFGHGVGMSQYGAQGMAQDGRNYREIIQHYYSGVRIEPIFAE